MAGPYVLGFVALIFLDFIRRLRRWHRLRHIPGPPLAGWTSFALTKPYLDGTIYEHWKELAEKYGEYIPTHLNPKIHSQTTTRLFH